MEDVVLLWIVFLAVQIQFDDGTESGNVHDRSSADDLMGDVEMHFALVVEGRYVGIVPCQPFMPRPHSKIVQDCLRRDRPVPQVKRVRRQFGSCLPCLHLTHRCPSTTPPLGLSLSGLSVLFRPETNPVGLIRWDSPVPAIAGMLVRRWRLH